MPRAIPARAENAVNLPSDLSTRGKRSTDDRVSLQKAQAVGSAPEKTTNGPARDMQNQTAASAAISSIE